MTQGGDAVRPYFESQGVVLYHGDSREVLAGLAPADLVLTDPPYNVGKQYGDHDDGMEGSVYEDWLRGVFSTCVNLAPALVYTPGTSNVWGVERLLTGTGYRPYSLLGWHKKEFAGDKWNGSPAHCWEPVVWASREEKPFYNKRFGTLGRNFLVVNATHGDPFRRSHPCPKPLPVMAWLVGLFAPVGGSLIDPFAGTGTTLRAAMNAGIRAVGIEQEERFCEAAAKRLSQGVLSFDD